MMSMSWMMMVMMLLSGGSGGELLNYLPTASYWKAKGVEPTPAAMLDELVETAVGDASGLIKQLGADDFQTRDQASLKLRAMGRGVVPQLQQATKADDAEVAARAAGLINEITAGNKAAVVRRLMAIRTLGELKATEGLPRLRKLSESQEPFVAEWARVAIDRIEGRAPAVRSVSAEQLAADLNLLPENCGAVAQASAGALLAEGASLESLLKELPEQARQKTIAKMQGELLKLAEATGNLRVDAVTIGVSADIGPETGFVVMIVRGQYDAAVARDLIRKELAAQSEARAGIRMVPDAHGPDDSEPAAARPFSRVINGIEVFEPDGDNIDWALPSNERFVFIAQANSKCSPAEKVVAALQSGKGTLHKNAALVKLIEGTDRAQPAWAVMQVTDSYRQAPLLGAFDSLRMGVRREGKDIAVRIEGAGKDANQVQMATTMFNTGLATVRKDVANEKMVPKSIKQAVESVKCESKDTTAIMTARLEGGISALAGSLVGEFGMLFGGLPEVEGIEPVTQPANDGADEEEPAVQMK